MLGTPVSIQTLMQCNIGPGQYQVLEWVATWEILVQLALGSNINAVKRRVASIVSSPPTSGCTWH